MATLSVGSDDVMVTQSKGEDRFSAILWIVKSCLEKDDISSNYEVDLSSKILSYIAVKRPVKNWLTRRASLASALKVASVFLKNSINECKYAMQP